jgi:hypothetical protein
MRQLSRWQSWRVTTARRPVDARLTPDPLAARMAHPPGFRRPAAPPDPLAALKAEAPNAAGVREGLVARLQELLAAGEYDTPDRLAKAEDALARKLFGG